MSGPAHELLGARLSQVANRVKGLLIILVAIDHNDWFRPLAPGVFGPLTFHVLGFFLLAFSFTKTPISLQFVADRVARYLLPFWGVLAVSSLAYGFAFKSSLSAAALLENFALAALIGSASLVKTSSGLFMLWFLPCLFGLTCLVAAQAAWRGPAARTVVWGLAALAHIALPYLSGLWVSWVPFGLLVAAQVFVLGLGWRQRLWHPLSPLVGPLALGVFLVSYGLLVQNKVHIEIGTFELSALQNPVILLLHGVGVYSALLALVWLAGGFSARGWIERFGQNSLLIYLVHPVFYLILAKLWVSPAQVATNWFLLLFHACTTTTLAVFFSYAASLVVTRSSTLSAWLIPRTWRTWPPAAYLSKRKSVAAVR